MNGTQSVNLLDKKMKNIKIFILEKPWWIQILSIIVATIIFIEIFGLIGTKILGPTIGWGDEVLKYWDVYKADNWEGRFVRWDAGYYLGIAQNGYRINGDERAFFPLYPLLCRFISKLTSISLLWSGFFISVLSFIASVLVFYRWVLIDYTPQVAFLSVLWICVFPMSFFFVAFYPEALFLLLSILSIYFARRGRFIIGGLAIALAGASRPQAFLLAIPFIMEFLQQRNFSTAQLLKFGTGVLIAPMGMIGYLGFISFQSGSANLFLSYMSIHASDWNRYITWPWLSLFDQLRSIFLGIDINKDWFSRVIVVQDLFYTLLGGVLAIWSISKLRLSSALFLISSMLFYMANHGPYGYAFWSMPRWVASLYPLYLGLALITLKLPVFFRWLFIAISVILLGLLSAWFVTGRWVA